MKLPAYKKQGDGPAEKPLGKIVRTTMSGSRVKLVVPVRQADFLPAFEKELEAIAADTHLEGFRPGKAPVSQVLAKIGRPRIEAGALDRAINAAYVKALQEEELMPVSSPTLTLDSFVAPAEDTDLEQEIARFTVEVDVLPSLTLKNYTKIKVKKPELIAVKDADVQDVVDYLRKQRAELKDIAADAAVSKGMWADIAFEGSVGGVAREDMKSDHHALIIGEGNLIPGFEDEVVGMKKGETKSFDITFPKDYSAKELAGKKATFSVTVNDVKDLILPPVDDTFAAAFGHKNEAELTKAIRLSLETERKQEQQAKLEDLVIDELLKLEKFEVPKSLVEQEENRLREETMKRAGGAPLPESLTAQIPVQAEKNVRIGIALGKVIDLENIQDKEKAMRIAMDKLIEYATA